MKYKEKDIVIKKNFDEQIEAEILAAMDSGFYLVMWENNFNPHWIKAEALEEETVKKEEKFHD